MIQKKSSVHSMATQSTKPTSHIANNFVMPQITSENQTVHGAADATS